MLGSTSTATAAAMMDLAVSSGTPQIAMAPVVIAGPHYPWVFSVPQPVSVMVSAIVGDAVKRGAKTISFLGYNDGLGRLELGAR